MQPVKEDINITPSEVNKKIISETFKVVSDFNNEKLIEFRCKFFSNYKKRRNKMRHLTPKRKKRKK